MGEKICIYVYVCVCVIPCVIKQQHRHVCVCITCAAHVPPLPLHLYYTCDRYLASYPPSRIISTLPQPPPQKNKQLRVIPPILLAVTTHLMAGLRGGMHFFTYTLVLVMLTTIAATLNLIIGMLTRSIMSGILVATIIMIHLILLTTIFVNFGASAAHGCLSAPACVHIYAHICTRHVPQQTLNQPHHHTHKNRHHEGGLLPWAALHQFL